MKNLNTIEKNDTRELNGGKTLTCCVCKKKVSGGFWTQYAHCIPHATKFVLGVGDAIMLCFGLAGL